MLEDEEHRLLLALAQQEELDGLQDALAALRRIESLPAAVLDRNIEQGEEGGLDRRERVIEGAQPGGHLLPDLVVTVALVQLEVALEEIDHRQVAGSLAVGEGGRFQGEPRLDAVGVSELVQEAGLPHPGFPDQGDDLAVAVTREGECPLDLLDLGLAADEAGEPPDRGRLQTGPLRAGSGERVDDHRVRQALDRDGRSRFDLRVSFHELPGRRGEQDRAGSRELLHAGGEVGRLPDRGVVHPEIVADRADHHVAGVEPDADLDLDPLASLEILPVAVDRILHPERGVAGAQRMILVGQRRAEERHDAVAHHLVDGPLVVMDGLHHALQDGIQELARLLRIPVRQQLHRALQVGEEHRDLLALAFEGSLRGEDPFRQMTRRVRLGRAELRFRDAGWGDEAAAAASAELFTALVPEAARRARGERKPALAAEPATFAALGVASRTPHAVVSEKREFVKGRTGGASLVSVSAPVKTEGFPPERRIRRRRSRADWARISLPERRNPRSSSGHRWLCTISVGRWWIIRWVSGRVLHDFAH